MNIIFYVKPIHTTYKFLFTSLSDLSVIKFVHVHTLSKKTLVIFCAIKISDTCKPTGLSIDSQCLLLPYKVTINYRGFEKDQNRKSQNVSACSNQLQKFLGKFSPYEIKMKSLLISVNQWMTFIKIFKSSPKVGNVKVCDTSMSFGGTQLCTCQRQIEKTTLLSKR